MHHGYYERGLQPWDYPDETLHTLCEYCHETREGAELKIRKALSVLSTLDVATLSGTILPFILQLGVQTYRQHLELREKEASLK